MAHLRIDDKKYHLPTDLSLSDWMKAAKCLTAEQSLAVTLGISIEQLRMVDKGIISLMVTLLAEVMYPAVKVNVRVQEKALIDFEKMTLGEFIDLDVLSAQGLHKTIDSMANILYGEGQYTIKEVWGAVKMFITWKSGLYKSYPMLFKQGEVKEDSMPEYNEIAKRWFDLVMVLANGDVLKMDLVTELPVKQAFNWLAWNKDQQRKAQSK